GQLDGGGNVFGKDAEGTVIVVGLGRDRQTAAVGDGGAGVTEERLLAVGAVAAGATGDGVVVAGADGDAEAEALERGVLVLGPRGGEETEGDALVAVEVGGAGGGIGGIGHTVEHGELITQRLVE